MIRALVICCVAWTAAQVAVLAVLALLYAMRPRTPPKSYERWAKMPNRYTDRLVIDELVGKATYDE